MPQFGRRKRTQPESGRLWARNEEENNPQLIGIETKKEGGRVMKAVAEGRNNRYPNTKVSRKRLLPLWKGGTTKSCDGYEKRREREGVVRDEGKKGKASAP